MASPLRYTLVSDGTTDRALVPRSGRGAGLLGAACRSLNAPLHCIQGVGGADGTSGLMPATFCSNRVRA